MTKCQSDSHRNELCFKANIIPPITIDCDTLLDMLEAQVPSLVVRTKSHVEYDSNENTIRVYSHSNDGLLECKQNLNNILYSARDYKPTSAENNSRKWPRKERVHDYFSMVLCNDMKLTLNPSDMPNRARVYNPQSFGAPAQDSVNMLYRNIGEMFKLYSMRALTATPPYPIALHFGAAYFRQSDNSLVEWDDRISCPGLNDLFRDYLLTLKHEANTNISYSRYFLVSVDLKGAEYRLYLHPIGKNKLECKKVIKTINQVFDCYLVHSKVPLDLKFSCQDESILVPSTNEATMKLMQFIKTLKLQNGQLSYENTRHVVVLEAETVEQHVYTLDEYMEFVVKSSDNLHKLSINIKHGDLQLTHSQFLQIVDTTIEFAKLFPVN